MMARGWTLRAPECCPQCQSIVWERRDWTADLFTRGRSWVCGGCGYELWETIDDRGEHQSGENRAACRCCGRVLKSGEAALNGYGGLCATGDCQCHDRALIRDQRRWRKRGLARLELTPESKA